MLLLVKNEKKYLIASPVLILFKACYTHSISTAKQNNHTAKANDPSSVPGPSFQTSSLSLFLILFKFIYKEESEEVKGGFSWDWSESARVRGFTSSPN